MRVAWIAVLTVSAVAIVSGQYVRELQSPNLGTNPYGGSYGYDIDGDYIRSLNVYGFKVVKPEALALMIAA